MELRTLLRQLNTFKYSYENENGHPKHALINRAVGTLRLLATADRAYQQSLFENIFEEPLGVDWQPVDIALDEERYLLNMLAHTAQNTPSQYQQIASGQEDLQTLATLLEATYGNHPAFTETFPEMISGLRRAHTVIAAAEVQARPDPMASQQRQAEMLAELIGAIRAAGPQAISGIAQEQATPQQIEAMVKNLIRKSRLSMGGQEEPDPLNLPYALPDSPPGQNQR